MMIAVASVAMNAFTRPSVISKPLPSPNASPTSAPRMSAPQRPMPVSLNAFAAAIPANAEIAPTDRSNPPAMKTSVPPAAMIPTGAVWNARFFMLSQDRKTSLEIERVTNSATNAITTP
jgi:hypothetical protein